MKRIIVVTSLVILLSACTYTSPFELSTEDSCLNTFVTNENNSGVSSIPQDTDHDKKGYFSVENDIITFWDYSTVFEMCYSALTQYYYASRNGTDIEMDLYVSNDNLKHFMEQKIDLEYSYSNDNRLGALVEIQIGVSHIELIAQKNMYYLMLVTKARSDYGGEFTEPTEFLVKTQNGNLYIVDWYTAGTGNYDIMIRGEFQNIDNPDIWNDFAWVEDINAKAKLYHNLLNTPRKND